ncbi:MAG: hypothetical protein JWN04_224 [Myxococcaceae bacterium]|nr:hypothetical protein [Myxococcaceae bacterium]
MNQARPSQTGLRLIALAKFVKVSVLLAVGITTLILQDRVPPESLTGWGSAVAPSNHWVHLLISKVCGVSERQLKLVSLGSFAYAAIFAVEGIGLLLQKTWAEYFTTCVTISFIPLELYELHRHFSISKVVAVALNVIVVVYLVGQLQRERRKKQSGAFFTAR